MLPTYRELLSALQLLQPWQLDCTVTVSMDDTDDDLFAAGLSQASVASGVLDDGHPVIRVVTGEDNN